MRRIIGYIRWDLKYLPYTFKNGVLNLFKWFNIIWRDRNHDYFYMLDILRKKIEIQAKHFEKSRFTSRTRDIQKMKLCVELIDKLMNESYIDEVDVNNLDEYFLKRKLTFEKIKKRSDYDQLRKEFVGYLVGREIHNKAKRILFKLIEENYEGWWY